MFITNGREGHAFALLAITDPHAQPRHRGMSCFIVEKGHPGFRVVKSLAKLGYKGVDTVELLFEGFVTGDLDLDPFAEEEASAAPYRALWQGAAFRQRAEILGLPGRESETRIGPEAVVGMGTLGGLLELLEALRQVLCAYELRGER